ncbi:DDB1- and CUL4-associated factor 8-like protein 2, partial [Lingula anatina]|uniref:DDB1- and CUL4-associated factor 8-like protein 2 n=1 Tax=Lingula anatina TaxID=7574 RepID=A0A1S3JXQ1_LINAN
MADEGVDEIASNNHHSDLLLSDCSNNHTDGSIQNNDCAITVKNETKSQLEDQGSSNNVRQGGLKSKNNTSDLDLHNTADLDPAPITDSRSDASMEVQHLELTGMREDDSGINVETASPSKSEISDTDVTSTTDSGINIAQQSDPESISIAESIKLENEASDAGKIDIFLDNDEVDDDDDDDLISSVQTLDHHSNTSTPVQSKETTAKVLVLQDIDNATKNDNKTDRSPNTDSKRGDLDPETTGQGQTPSVSQTSDFNDGMLPDMVDTDDSNPIGQYDFNVDEEMKVYRKQKRDRRMSTSSSSDDDLDDLAFGKEDDAKFSSDDEDEDKSNMDLDNSSPLLNNWHALGQLRQRELGVSNWKHPRLFAIDCHASLYMVQKLQLQYKMEKHDGCVNALHFNETGTRIASGSDDLQVILWNWMENKPALAFDSGHRSNVFQ